MERLLELLMDILLVAQEVLKRNFAGGLLTKLSGVNPSAIVTFWSQVIIIHSV
jgi:hypothetical protein